MKTTKAACFWLRSKDRKWAAGCRRVNIINDVAATSLFSKFSTTSMKKGGRFSSGVVIFAIFDFFEDFDLLKVVIKKIKTIN